MKQKILSAAMQLANLKDFRRVTRAAIAKRAGVAPGLVSYHFKGMKGLRDAVVTQAVETESLKIVGQALAAGHPIAKKAPESLRRAAASSMAGV